jgi:hypothetical protein
MRFPPSITAGDSAAWVDYPFADALGNPVDATAYALGYSLRGPIASAGVDLTGTAQGTGWAFALTPAQSAALNVGTTSLVWYWQAYATKTGVRLTAGNGRLTVLPNLSAITTSATYDGRSQAAQLLATVEAAIAARINNDAVTEYMVGNRSLKKEPMAELVKLRDKYRMIVSRERKAQMIANGLGNPTRLGVRFRA